ncbi:MAG: MerR family transcriptional regulator [Herbinix sp.]|jgi:DNA-binding transcriptional MerR regulator|nr:MerR family transcriptional regulator [Herbinix sp.]
MLINETSKATNLTKKAIEYYTEQNLIFPDLLDNGYRDFSDNDIECLKKISVLRKLGLSIGEIKAVLSDEKGDTLKKLSVRNELNLKKERAKYALLDKLSCGKSYTEISAELVAVEQHATVTEKLLDAFPGYYGRFISLHWAYFLNDPIITEEQKSAYNEILMFLDNIPPLSFPENLQSYIDEATKDISTIDINNLSEKTKQSIINPETFETFLSENKEVLETYLAYIQSDEYKNSPMFQMKALLIEFNKTSGYYEILIPAMKKLSPSYAEYCKQCEIANEKLYAQYPDARKLDYNY